MTSGAPPTRAGLIGLGTIGSAVARIVAEQDAGGIEIVGALVRDPARPRPGPGPALVATVDELLARGPNVIVEAAGHEALRAHGPAVLRAGYDLLFLSVGALADDAFASELASAAHAAGARAIALSGAIGGLDALAAAATGGLDRVTHTARKPPRALLPPAEAAALRAPRVLYQGPAREGVRRFPENVNVAAAVALAGLGLDRTELVVIADPGVDRNVHLVEAEGAFGSLRFEIRNAPTAENPRTGRIVAMSVVRALRARRSPLVVG